MKKFRLKKSESLVMKVVGPNGESRGNFRWPLDVGAHVEAPDWDPTAACGGGLHGWLWGLGDSNVGGRWVCAPDATWLALTVTTKDVIDLGGKVKFQSGRIAFRGGRTAVANFIAAHRPLNTPPPMYGTSSAGNGGTSSAGEYGTSSAGNGGTSSAGNGGTSSAGSNGLAAVGAGGVARGGNRAILVAGYWRDPQHTDHTFCAGQVGRDGIEPDIWYEGSPDGLRRVPDTDPRVIMHNGRVTRIQVPQL